MNRNYDDDLLAKRMLELSARAEKTGHTVFSDFLTPADVPLCRRAAKEKGLVLTLQGGYSDAERVIAGFGYETVPDDEFPISALEIRWPHQTAPRHQDLLGALMALGVSRACTGDIVVMQDWAALFVQSKCSYIESMFTQAGGCHLQVRLLEQWPSLAPQQGVTIRGTVSSLRLDAVMATGYHISRGNAALSIAAGNVKVNYVQVFKTDTRIIQGDVISLRGSGRLVVNEIGNPTRKDRLPLVLTRFGTSR